MKITISKDSEIPMRDQLVEQIGLQIASGVLKEKDKLPSIRALAQRLGIHHSTVTAAYNHLADIGLLEVRQGSGVRVASSSKALGMHASSPSVDGLLRAFLLQAADCGFSRSEIEQRLKSVLNPKPVKRILVVDRNKDFHPLLIAELQPQFSLPVEPITHDELDANIHLLEDSFVLSTMYHVYPLQNMPTDPARLIVCNIEPGKEQMEAVNALPDSSIVLLVSVSSTLLRMGRNVIAAMRGDGVAVRCVTADEEQELKYMMQYAALVVCDKASYPKVKALAGAKPPVAEFRLYSQATLKLIKDRLAKWG